MKTKLLSLLAFVALLAFASCSYDDSELQNRVEQLEKEMVELQATVSQMNTNLQALQTTVNVLTSGDYIKSVTPVTSGDETVGYTFTFGKNDPITIYNGEDGTNGSTPAISVVVGEDGKYYWTVNGEIMKDAQGNSVSATGVAPLLRINDGVWQYSIDNGSNWTNVAVEGYAGVIFKDIVVGDNAVNITLGNGLTFEIPLLGEFALSFDQTLHYGINGTEISINYSISGADELTNIIVFPSGDVKAEIVKENNSKGVIKVTRGADAEGNVQVLVMASNGKGQKDYEILNISKLEMTITSVDLAFVKEGGEETVEVSSNIPFTVKLSEDVKWLTYEFVETKAANSGTLTISTIANPLRLVRTVEVRFVDQYGFTIKAIKVAQSAADYPTGGQLEDIPVLPA